MDDKLKRTITIKTKLPFKGFNSYGNLHKTDLRPDQSIMHALLDLDLGNREYREIVDIRVGSGRLLKWSPQL